MTEAGLPVPPHVSDLAVIDADTGLPIPRPAGLFTSTDPHQSLLEAKAHADVLADVIKERQLFVVVGRKAHVMVEAWTFLGSRLGVFPVLDGVVEPVEVEGVQGFRATVQAVTRAGEVLGRATAYCMRDEPTWKGRPIHTLAAMAETRATSRALRKPLGFIVQLAGYNATAAEEMIGVGGGGAAPLPVEPGDEDLPEALQRSSASPPGVISEKQRGRLWAISDSRGIDEGSVRDIIEQHTGQRSSQPIPRKVYDLIISDIEAWEPAE